VHHTGGKHPWGAGIEVPNASSNFDNFVSIGMKKISIDGIAWSWILL
jgi:hypothetical protein